MYSFPDRAHQKHSIAPAPCVIPTVTTGFVTIVITGTSLHNVRAVLDAQMPSPFTILKMRICCVVIV